MARTVRCMMTTNWPRMTSLRGSWLSAEAIPYFALPLEVISILPLQRGRHRTKGDYQGDWDRECVRVYRTVLRLSIQRRKWGRCGLRLRTIRCCGRRAARLSSTARVAVQRFYCLHCCSGGRIVVQTVQNYRVETHGVATGLIGDSNVEMRTADMTAVN